MEIPSEQTFTIQATVIRKDGKREELGTVYGGNFFRKVDSYLRIKLANFKHGNRTH